MRIAISIIAALFVTVALFYLMQSLVKGSGQSIDKPVNYGVVDFVRLQREPEDRKMDAEQRVPSRPAAQPPRALPELASQLPKARPSAVPQAEFATGELVVPQLSKPYLDAAEVVIPKPNPVRKKTSVKKIEQPPRPAQPAEVKTPTPAIAKVTPTIQSPALTPLPADSANEGGDDLPLAIDAPPGLQGDGGDNEAEAIPIFKMKPKYPRKAARSRIEGWVKVEFTITEKGTVADAKVVESKPRRTFDRSAIQSIRKWRFKPRVVDGKPVRRKASQVIEFRLSRG